MAGQQHDSAASQFFYWFDEFAEVEQFMPTHRVLQNQSDGQCDPSVVSVARIDRIYQ